MALRVARRRHEICERVNSVTGLASIGRALLERVAWSPGGSRPNFELTSPSMPVVLSQRTWHDDPKYLDREGVIYHYPRQYRGRINDYDRFIYYRPATGASPEEASTYVGHGRLRIPYEDFARNGYWFALNERATHLSICA